MKRTLLLVCTMALSLASYAQSPTMTQTDSVDLDPYTVINAVLSRLDMSNVSAGLFLLPVSEITPGKREAIRCTVFITERIKSTYILSYIKPLF